MIDTIIYDLGGVLIDWNPMYVFEDYFDRPEDRDYFFSAICTAAWNEEQDGGRTIAEGTQLLIDQFPEWEYAIRDYYGRWTEMIKGPIQESVDLLSEIRSTGQYRLYALTNWSAETFPHALQRFDFLSWFEGILVSGEEKTRKPFDDFYFKLLEKYSINKESALFIDDNLRNVEAGKRLGIQSIQFTNTESLRKSLSEAGIRI